MMEASTPAPVRSSLFKRIIMRSAKLPVLYFLIGLAFAAVSYIDNVLPLTRIVPLPYWEKIYEITDKLGSIMIALALLSFFYNVVVISLRKMEIKLAEKHSVASLIISSIRNGLRLIYALIAINIIIILVGPSQFYLLLANNVLNTIIIGSLGWIAVQILYTAEAVLYQHMMSLPRKELVRGKALYTKMHIIRNIATAIIVVVTIAAVLMSFNSVRNIGISLLASAGFLTAIVGLGAQKALASLFTGLQIALSQPIKIGDIVVIENTSGVIEEITLTYVTLKLSDRRRLIIPINYFTEKPFENWSRETDSLRSSMHLFVDYMLPIEPMRKELDTILQSSPFWDGKDSKVQVSNLTERAVEVAITVSACNADELSDLRAEVREKILAFIRDNYPEHFPKVRFDGNEAIAIDDQTT